MPVSLQRKTPTVDSPRQGSVSQEQAEKLFRDAFNGRGLDDMLQEETGAAKCAASVLCA